MSSANAGFQDRRLPAAELALEVRSHGLPVHIGQSGQAGGGGLDSGTLEADQMRASERRSRITEAVIVGAKLFGILAALVTVNLVIGALLLKAPPSPDGP